MSKTPQSKVPFKVGKGGLSLASQSIVDKLNDIDNIVKAVILVLLIMVATMVVATFSIYNDQAHFNSETYDNYKNEQGNIQNQLTNDKNQIDQLQSEVNALKAGH